MEWKSGRRSLAHSIISFLQNSAPSKGRTQPYVYSADLYKKESRFLEAYQTILEGLRHQSNAGMLWFEALQLQQQLIRTGNYAFLNLKVSTDTTNADGTKATQHTLPSPSPSASALATQLDSTKSLMEEYLRTVLVRFKDEAMANLSPELLWKFYLELATIYSRANDIQAARNSLALSVRHIPNQQQLWKVWVHGSRIELLAGNVQIARKLLFETTKLVPAKALHTVLLEYSRIEEYLGNPDEARYILQKAKTDTKHEWKVHNSTLPLVFLNLKSD